MSFRNFGPFSPPTPIVFLSDISKRNWLSRRATPQSQTQSLFLPPSVSQVPTNVSSLQVDRESWQSGSTRCSRYHAPSVRQRRRQWCPRGDTKESRYRQSRCLQCCKCCSSRSRITYWDNGKRISSPLSLTSWVPTAPLTGQHPTI